MAASPVVAAHGKSPNYTVPMISFKAKNCISGAVSICGIALSVLMQLAYAGSKPPQAPYRIQELWKVGGEGGWRHLLLDTSHHLLYIPRTDQVTVIDTDTGKEAGKITGLVNARDIALDDQGRYGYVTDMVDGATGVVRVFDCATLKVTTAIPIGIHFDDVIFELLTKKVVAFSMRGKSAVVINSASNEVVSTITVPGRPSAAVSDGKGQVFVTMNGTGVIARLDASSMKVTASWAVKPCVGPFSLAFDKVHRTILAACENDMVIAVDANTGKIRPVTGGNLQIGELAFDSNNHLLFSTSNNGTLSILRQDSGMHYSLVQELETQLGGRAFAIDPVKDRIYLASSKYGLRTGKVSEELEFRPTPVADSFSIIVIGR